MGVAGDLNSLLLARLLYGTGIGFAMHAAPAYISETSPPNVRGLLISVKEAFIVGGILLGYLTSFLFIDHVGGWRSMYGAAAPIALALGLGMVGSPRARGVQRQGGCRQRQRRAGQREVAHSSGAAWLMPTRVRHPTSLGIIHARPPASTSARDAAC